MRNYAYYIKRILILLIGIGWAWFGLVSGPVQSVTFLDIFKNWPNALPGIIIIISALIAWFKETIGGLLLFLEGIIVLIGYPVLAYGYFSNKSIIIVVCTLALPAVLIGVLFMKNKTSDDNHNFRKRI